MPVKDNSRIMSLLFYFLCLYDISNTVSLLNPFIPQGVCSLHDPAFRIANFRDRTSLQTGDEHSADLILFYLVLQCLIPTGDPHKSISCSVSLAAEPVSFHAVFGFYLRYSVYAGPEVLKIRKTDKNVEKVAKSRILSLIWQVRALCFNLNNGDVIY